MDILTYQRVPLLEKEDYGYWKVIMKAIIQGIDEDAWTAIEDGYETPKLTERDGSIVIKPKSRWTKNEKHLSMCNAKALSTIFTSVNRTQFKLIQGCSSAKEAWEKLEKVFEGTSKVKTCRLDMLASKFERLNMEENETIEEFSSKISSIASEAQVLGKKYNDKKLVKKLFRSLHPKFESKKTAMQTALDTDQLDFEEAVGHFQAYEMEINPPKEQEPKELAFMPEERKEIHELKEVVNKLVKQTEAWNLAGNIEDKGMKHMKKDNRRCYVCQGVGHLKATCATVKKKEEIKCGVCKGFGHTNSECSSNNQKSRNDNIESESDGSDDDMTGFVTFPAIIEETDSDSDDEVNQSVITKSGCDNMSMEELYQSWVKLGKEKIELFKQKVELEEQLDSLKTQLKEEKENKCGEGIKILKKEQINDQNLLELNTKLSQELRSEQEKRKNVEIELSETMKKVQMLNSGTKELNKILSEGRSPESHYGIGYDGKENTARTIFVASSTSHADEMKPITTQKDEGSSSMLSQQSTIQSYDKWHGGQRSSHKACYHCGKNGHIRRKCYVFKRWVQTLIQQGYTYQNKGRKDQVWISKAKLYKKDEQSKSSKVRVCKKKEELETEKSSRTENVAVMAGKIFSRRRWYFDSEASQHMTGNLDLLDDYVKIEERKVTFGDGACGMIKGKGRSSSPDLKNVYYVQGLKENLISVSQLSDEGYKVSFDEKSCRVRDNSDKIVMTGTRADKNCYMWEPMKFCFKAENNEWIFDCICTSK